MKRNEKQLRARSLDVRALKQVHGGRGTACGDGVHCPDCGHKSPIGSDYCEACGAFLGGGECP